MAASDGRGTPLSLPDLFRLVKTPAQQKLWEKTGRTLAESLPDLVSVTLLLSSSRRPDLEYIAGEMPDLSMVESANLQLRGALQRGEQLRMFWLDLTDVQDKPRYKHAIAPLLICDGKAIGCLLASFASAGSVAARPPVTLGRAATHLRLVLEKRWLESSLARVYRALEDCPGAIILLDASRHIEYVNPLFTATTGFELADVLGRPVEVLNSRDLGQTSFSDQMWRSVESNHSWQMENLQRRKDGEHYWAETRISCIRDSDGSIRQYFILQHDFTESRLLSAKLSYSSAHDSVTGLLNRMQFESHLEEVLASARSYDSVHVMIFLGLDEFKLINDTCGYSAGDELLRQLALLIREIAGDNVFLSRVGADEFAILLEQSSLEIATSLAEKLLDVIHKFRFRWRGKVYVTGTSIGISVIDNQSVDAQEVMRQADISCFVAKDKGRNRLHVFNPKDDALLLRHGEAEWSSRISECLAEGRFELFGQPIVPVVKTKGANRVHAEILVRMIDREGARVSPAAFMAAAERYNLASDIDRWVAENTINWLLDKQGNDQHIERLSINLSGHSLTDSGFLEFLLALLDRPGLPTGKLCFEITETVAVENFTDALHFISAVKQKGCFFALDDFGTGMSSFAYLKNMPVDYLKIDGHFIRRIDVDPIDYSMLKSINEIGHLMGMKTVAEYVESQPILDRLWAIGVDYAQGHLLGQAQLLDDLMSESVRSGSGSGSGSG